MAVLGICAARVIVRTRDIRLLIVRPRRLNSNLLWLSD